MADNKSMPVLENEDAPIWTPTTAEDWLKRDLLVQLQMFEAQSSKKVDDIVLIRDVAGKAVRVELVITPLARAEDSARTQPG